MKRFLIIFRFVFFASLLVLLAATSVWQPADEADRIRAYTRRFEFDFFGWTANALWQKLSALSLGPMRHMTYPQQRKVLRDYFQALSDTLDLRDSLETLYADPLSTINPEDETKLEEELKNQEQELERLALLAEAVLQDQVSRSLDDLGLTVLPQPLPPVLYHVTDLPKNLVISPREVIRQEKSVSLVTGIGLDDEIMVESQVEENTGYSALVVPVGGVSTYPTMVIRTGSILGLLETVTHEWTHNYLVFRPLGWNYSTSPALRTMNETTASIAGDEISQYVVRKFYNDLIKPEEDLPYQTYEVTFPIRNPFEKVDFDFRKEMYETRLRVDELLEQDKIEEAEFYMEEQRQVFWANGYRIRKLNQAYFAFHGAYADQPYSAAGADPVGEDVRLLRSRSESLAKFILTMSRISSYQSLIDIIHAY